MGQILSIISPLFVIIFAAALLQKYKNIGDHWSKVLNDFALKIGLPVLIFSALVKSPISFSSEALLILANSLFILLSFLLAFIIGKLLRLSKEMLNTLFICFAFCNVAYLGIPVLTQISGEKILPTASLIVGVYLFWLFTIGISYLDYSSQRSGKGAIKNIAKNLLKNPLIISVLLGVIISALKIPLPIIIIKSLDMITASVTPTVLIVIGLFIGKSKIGRIKEWFPVLLFSILTLMVLPAIFYFGVKMFGSAPSQFSSSIIQAAMPLAITPFALADQYKLKKDFIARSIVLSTILSVLSLPFWIFITN